MVIDKPLCDATQDGQRLFDRLHSTFAGRNSEAYIASQIQGTHLDYVAQGKNRIVFVDTDGEYLSAADACVVKINKKGENNSNKVEFENFQRITGELEKYLMPITDWHKNQNWTVMPYITTDATEEMRKELEKEFLRKGYKVRDVNKRNTARVQDHAVLLDYDQFIERVNTDVMDIEERLRLIDWKYE